MPLKLTRRGDVYYVRGTVKGIYTFETSGTSEKRLAEEFRAAREAELYQEALYGKRASATFEQGALSYLDAAERSASTKLQVLRLSDHFGATLASKIKQDEADKAVIAIVGKDAADGTKNRVYTFLIAVLRHMAHMGWCDPPNIKKRPKPKGRTNWMTPAQALALIEACSPHMKPLAQFILCTGARMAEAIDLTWEDVHLSDAKVIFRDTKNGKDRVAGLTPAAIVALANIEGERDGAVFRTQLGEPYADKERQEGGQVKSAWRGACRRAGLVEMVEQTKGEPRIQMKHEIVGPFTPVYSRPLFTPHDMRHTWSSWFYALTRDPMLLRDEGGWSSITMVERYAHLMPREMTPEIARIWGPSHPRIGRIDETQEERNARVS